MSTFVLIGRFRTTADAAGTREQYQAAVNHHFAEWDAPAGADLVALYPGVDLRTVVGIWEGNHSAIATVAAQLLPWVDVEVIPVASVEETIQSMVAGGLVKPPWTIASST